VNGDFRPSHKTRKGGYSEREWQKQYQDPDDVFSAARARKQEIREQIRNLQKGLERRRSRRKPRAKKRS
jgi:hypothetical protein